MKKRLFLISCVVFMLGLFEPSQAATLFQDDFNDGAIDLAKWAFGFNYADGWYENGGVLGNTGGRSSLPVYAYFKNITTPLSFILEADVIVISNNYGVPDFGYVGFFWGETFNSWTVERNMTYLDINKNKTISWSTNGQNVYGVDAPLDLSEIYHLSVTVDGTKQFVTISIGDNQKTFTGDAYDNINKNIGYFIGLLSWGDNVCWDNVKLSTLDTPAVPVPSSLQLFWAVLVGFAGINRKRIRN